MGGYEMRALAFAMLYHAARHGEQKKRGKISANEDEEKKGEDVQGVCSCE